MTDKTARSPLFRAADRAKVPEQPFTHPLNPKSEVRIVSLSEAVGLQRTGLHVMRIPPGKESFAFHTHRCEEEFMYVLSGRGVAEIGDQVVEIGPGDFLGFPTPSVGHHLRNPFDEDLVYLSGGERRAVEIADFPKLGKQMVRDGMTATLYPLASGERLTFE